MQIAAQISGRTIREIYELIEHGQLPVVRDGVGMVVVPEHPVAVLRR